MIRVQAADFDPGAELARLTRDRRDIGGLASFVGLVREWTAGGRLTAMTLEHYSGMTERRLAAIEVAAHARWPLAATLILHRFGRLLPGERIVLVAAASAHRDAAFEACRFLIDFLKTDAPFWKKEETATGAAWVAASAADATRAARWRPQSGGEAGAVFRDTAVTSLRTRGVGEAIQASEEPAESGSLPARRAREDEFFEDSGRDHAQGEDVGSGDVG